MIGTYIKELLKNHNRVIVPDLGAFLRKNDNPDLLYFNEFLRFNDGLLVDFLAKKENIDKFEAAKQIKGYVSDINKTIRENQQVELKDLGTLFMDSTDKIQLKIDLLKEYVPEESIITETKKPENIVEAKEIKEVKEVVEVKKEPLIVTPPPVPIAEEKKVIPNHKEKTKEPSIIEKKPELIKEVKPQIIEAPSILPEKTLPPEIKKTEPKKVEPTPTIVPTPEKQRSGKAWLWFTILVVLILLFATWIFVIKPRYDHTVNQNNIVNESPVITPKENAEIDNSPKEDINENNKGVKTTAPTKIATVDNTPKANALIKEKKTVHNAKPETVAATATMTTNNNKMYYLVVGCFAMESNADKLIQSLKAKGFSAEKFAKIDDMYFVSIASFSDKLSAQSEITKLKADGYNCWIKYH